MNRLGIVLLGAAMVLGCSDDNTPDSAVTPSIDAKTFDAGAATIDAAPATGDAAVTNSVTFDLTKAGEPSPCANNPGATAAGSATVTVSADNSIITVSGTYSGLSMATAGAGHIHFGTTADSGPIVLQFGNVNPTFTESLTASDYKNAGTGTPPAPADFATFVTMMKAGGNAYINFHTTNCPAGEIRGEIPAFPNH